MSELRRRRFLKATAGGLGIGSLLSGLGSLSATETDIDNVARFPADLEPLVRYLEETPRDELIEGVATRIRDGLSYRELLAAVLLAGVRNVQPRPSVGFKFHAVLVVNSAHLASLNSTDDDRWLPMLWAVDNFKNSQLRDVQEGNWTMAPVAESRVPAARQATPRLREALESWDAEAADVAIASMTRHFGVHYVFEQLASFAARDFRSIGHKVIFLSNAFRTLQTIGWNYAEPVLRSLVYAMQNHSGESNPSTSDHAADRPGRINRQRAGEIPESWKDGTIDDAATIELLQILREGSADEASAGVVTLLSRGVSIQSIWDAIFASAGELMMRQRGIVSLHAVTTSNALHHVYRTSSDDQTRLFAVLQNASFLTMFREAARGRGKLADRQIETLEAVDVAHDEAESVTSIFRTIGKNHDEAARLMYGYLQGGGEPKVVADHARRLVFLKGNDSHDYKFSSAALEDYRNLTPAWRNRYLAAATYQLRSENEPTRPLVGRIRKALG